MFPRNDEVGTFHLIASNIIHKVKVYCGHGGLVIIISKQPIYPYITQRSEYRFDNLGKSIY